ncbi:MAG: hypothetical protein MJA83_01825 [Gammaproteobacteria bacterium]|nr:hypothetical protein [Gammaproteobacteria bacterium]
MTSRASTGAVIALLLIFTLNAAADEYPEEARRRLDHLAGTWEVRTEYPDMEGGIARVVTWRDIYRYTIKDRVLEVITDAPEFELYIRGWVFYNITEKKFYYTSVGQRGDHWILKGDLDNYVLTSDVRYKADGSEYLVRFTFYDIEDDSFIAAMEFTTNNGRTWIPGFRQFHTRVKE